MVIFCLARLVSVLSECRSLCFDYKAACCVLYVKRGFSSDQLSQEKLMTAREQAQTLVRRCLCLTEDARKCHAVSALRIKEVNETVVTLITADCRGM